MTSSLVGSEMCIRDRPKGGGRHLPRSGNRCWESEWRKPAKLGTRKAPVSYTHLTLPTICSV
eukprot:4761185-Prorocentrum_lima.AAC.1